MSSIIGAGNTMLVGGVIGLIVVAAVWKFIPNISRYKYDTHTCVQKLKAPLLIVHSAKDDVIPYGHGKRLFEAASEPKTFLDIEGGHNDGFIFMRPDWVKELAVFLESTADRSPFTGATANPRRNPQSRETK